MGASVTRTVKYILKGDKGEKGASLRGPQAWSDCAVGYSFQAGNNGDSYKDLVMYGDNYYSCIKDHVKTASNYPTSIDDNNNGYWQLGDKIDLIATKILLATYALVKNLGVEAIDMKDNSGNILFQAKDGNVICKTGTFENITFSGTMQGVSGSFKSLDCVNENGTKVGGIQFGADGRMWFNGDIIMQYNSPAQRNQRLYAYDVWCRGAFGASERTVLEIKGSYGYYHSKGTDDAGVYVQLFIGTAPDGTTYYKIPCVGDSDDYLHMPVDELVFNIQTSGIYTYDLKMNESQRMLVVNANNNSNDVQIYSFGGKVTWNGGEIAEVAKLSRFANPYSPILGQGLFIGAFRDNNWS